MSVSTFLLAVFVVLCAVLAVDATICPATLTDTAGTPSNMPDWMGKLGHSFKELRLNEVVIPGSHDAGLYPPIKPKAGKTTAEDRSARTHALSMVQQMCAGWRWFDVRLKPKGQSWLFEHFSVGLGGFGGQDWNQVKKDVMRFLTSYPDEIVHLKFRLNTITMTEFVKNIAARVSYNIGGTQYNRALSDFMFGSETDNGPVPLAASAYIKTVLARVRARQHAIHNDNLKTGAVILIFDIDTDDPSVIDAQISKFNDNTLLPPMDPARTYLRQNTEPKAFIFNRQKEEPKKYGGTSTSVNPDTIINGQQTKLTQYLTEFQTTVGNNRVWDDTKTPTRGKFGYRFTSTYSPQQLTASSNILKNTVSLWNAKSGTLLNLALKQRDGTQPAQPQATNIGYVGNLISLDFSGVMGYPLIPFKYNPSSNQEAAKNLTEPMFVVAEFNRRVSYVVGRPRLQQNGGPPVQRMPNGLLQQIRNRGGNPSSLKDEMVDIDLEDERILDELLDELEE